jgi:hypothetical protein
MNTSAIIYSVFFSVIILLSLFVLGFFHKLKKYISINLSASNSKIIQNFSIGLISLFLIGFLINNKNNSSSNTTTREDNNLETFENNRKQAMIHRCGREWNGERDETYGIYGDYCCLRCYADFYPN